MRTKGTWLSSAARCQFLLRRDRFDHVRFKARDDKEWKGGGNLSIRSAPQWGVHWGVLPMEAVFAAEGKKGHSKGRLTHFLLDPLQRHHSLDSLRF